MFRFQLLQSFELATNYLFSLNFRSFVTCSSILFEEQSIVRLWFFTFYITHNPRVSFPLALPVATKLKTCDGIKQTSHLMSAVGIVSQPWLEWHQSIWIVKSFVKAATLVWRTRMTSSLWEFRFIVYNLNSSDKYFMNRFEFSTNASC